VPTVLWTEGTRMTETTSPTDGPVGTVGPIDIDRAPLGVKLLSMVVVVAAILDLSLASLMVLNRSTSGLQAETGLSSGSLLLYATGIGVVGLFGFVLGVGLRAGSPWARVATIAVSLLRLVGLGAAMFVFSTRQWYTAIVPAVIYAVVAYYLMYDHEARDYFVAP
jgi:hypothetical protein